MALTEGPEQAGRAAAERARYERDELLAISRALSSERDIHKLLDLILLKSRQITGADAGSVYVVESTDWDPDATPEVVPRRDAFRRRSAALEQGKKRHLHFMLSQNDSMPVNFREFRLEVDERSVAGKAVLTGRSINIADVRPGAERDAALARHDRRFDEQTGYEARSMLTLPMTSAMGEVLGVIQLINKKRDPSVKLAGPAEVAAQVVAFDARAEEMALALASQAGVSLENAILYDEIRRLFESFVDASVTAIEARDPTTSGHSRRVATLSVALAEKVDTATQGSLASVHFSREELRQIEYAGVLHDFGKVGVREQVLVKAKKLYAWQLDAIAMRLRYAKKLAEAEALHRKITVLESAHDKTMRLAAIDRELVERTTFLDRCWEAVTVANEPASLAEPTRVVLAEMARQGFVDDDGSAQPYLTPGELAALEVPRGTLTSEERAQIQRHVDHTIEFLRMIPWGRSLRNVPAIAGAHHELLDGSGYPSRLRGNEIPLESRILTIADIFDALTAADRPYKSAVPVERAIDILGGEVKAGKCDGELLRLFVEAEVYKQVL
jgi:HD-GYP domain-containing protein (c-di-GMP phosphodiesterase class II)